MPTIKIRKTYSKMGDKKRYKFRYKEVESKCDITVADIKEMLRDGVEVNFERSDKLSDDDFLNAKLNAGKIDNVGRESLMRRA